MYSMLCSKLQYAGVMFVYTQIFQQYHTKEQGERRLNLRKQKGGVPILFVWNKNTLYVQYVQ